MKKNIILQGMAIIALLAASCTKGLDGAQEEQTSTPITITASYGDGGTKVAYSEDGNTISATWDLGDELLVVCNGHVSELLLSSRSEDMGTATFNGNISGSPQEGNLLSCYVYGINNQSAFSFTPTTISISNAAFLSQDGTLNGAGSCNIYSGSTTYVANKELSVAFGVNTSILKFDVKAPAGVTAGTTGATLTYKSGATELAKATFTVGPALENTIYLAVPTGQFDGDQTLVYTSGSTEKTRFLSKSHATFAAGHTYSKEISFNNFVDLSAITSDMTNPLVIGTGQELTGTLDPDLDVKVCIADGATVTLSDVKIISTHPRAAITCEGNANIILKNKNELVGGTQYPGLQAGPVETTLTISGTGSLNASCSSSGGAGIGGYWHNGNTPFINGNVGSIIINGGVITAKGVHGAGIGSGASRNCQNITINGGTIIAESIGEGAGIGAGKNAGCGNIIITGGDIIAKNTGSDGGGAGVGSGNCYELAGVCGNISISGGTIVAKGGGNGAGIGTGYAYQHNNTCGTITISGMADVTATGGSYSAGIGTGTIKSSGTNSCGAVLIKGGQVAVKGGYNAAAIGTGAVSGGECICSTVGITASIVQVTVTKGTGDSKYIGAGHNSSSTTTITIDDYTTDNIADARTVPELTNLYSTVSDDDIWTLTQK